MNQPLDFKTIFEALPNLNLILSADPEFIMLAATDAGLRATLKSREDCIGRPLFEVFGNNPGETAASGSGLLRASLEPYAFCRRVHLTAWRSPNTMFSGRPARVAVLRRVTGARSTFQC